MSQQKNYAQLGDYILQQRLGDGGQAKVMKGVHKETGEVKAIKIYKYEQMSQNQIKNLQQEIQYMQNLKHKNIVNLDQCIVGQEYIKKNGNTYKCFGLVIQIAEKDNLYDYCNYTGKFQEPVVRYFFRQMLDGINFMHTQGVTHRDIKPENLLLNKDFDLLLADFGFTQIMGKNSTGFLHSNLGTNGYKAPEIHDQNCVYIGSNVDIYSSGIVLFIMVAGFPPISNLPPNKCQRVQFLYNQDYIQFWDKLEKQHKSEFDNDFKDLIQNMLSFRGQTRITISEIINHPWMQREVASKEQIQEEFEKRNMIIKQNQEKERLKKLQKKLENQNGQQTLEFVGTNIYRSTEGIHKIAGFSSSELFEVQKYHKNLFSQNRKVKKFCGQPKIHSLKCYEENPQLILIHILKFLEINQIHTVSIKDNTYEILSMTNQSHFKIDILEYGVDDDQCHIIEFSSNEIEYLDLQKIKKRLSEYLDQKI